MKSSFRQDFLRLNKDMQKRVSAALEELETNPDTPRGDTIKKLRHHEKLWRYRIGDYRMIYAVYPQRKLVQVLGIGPRGEIYERFGYAPDNPEYGDYSAVLEQALDPDQETPSDWLQYVKPREKEDQSRTLPFKLTAESLAKWRIPADLHHYFLGCETEDQLQNCGAPETYILHLIDCLWPASVTDVVSQPNLLVQKPGDLVRYASGDLIDFLLLLDADQEKFVDWALRGPTLVKGGPGSGKSTVALYRVRSLIQHFTEENETASVLFTTYTNALVEFSRQLINHLLENIDNRDVELEVSTVDRIAMQIVSRIDGKPEMAKPQDLKYAITSARAAYSPQTANPLEAALIRKAIDTLREDYLIEEIEWVIEGRVLETLDEYQKTDRTGRGYAFDARMRAAVWEIYQHVCRFLESLGKHTWGWLRKRAIELLLSGKWTKRWDYVIIDEAQDLTPAALALCIELAKGPEGMFLTADASQSLYNRGFAWQNVHQSMRVVGRTRILKRNYRTTRQIAVAAASIMRDTQAGDQEALDQFYVHVGPKPLIYEAVDNQDQFLWLADRLQRAAQDLRLPIGSIAILSPTNDLAREAANILSSFGLPTVYMQGRELNLDIPAAKSLTIHACKGLEFPIVAIPYAEEGIIPRLLADERAEDWEKHLDQERRVFFVGCTRAMRHLYVTYRKGQISSFLQTADPELWDRKSFDAH
jgi:superfamily I DNA/RNA helicase/mRNA-degrading endonuclease RelE of RelBE toxin-antitoxin system